MSCHCAISTVSQWSSTIKPPWAHTATINHTLWYYLGDVSKTDNCNWQTKLKPWVGLRNVTSNQHQFLNDPGDIARTDNPNRQTQLKPWGGCSLPTLSVRLSYELHTKNSQVTVPLFTAARGAALRLLLVSAFELSTASGRDGAPLLWLVSAVACECCMSWYTPQCHRRVWAWCLAAMTGYDWLRITMFESHGFKLQCQLWGLSCRYDLQANKLDTGKFLRI